MDLRRFWPADGVFARAAGPAVLAVVAAAGLGLLWLLGRPPAPTAPAAFDARTEQQPFAPEAVEVVVHVVGEVAAPGLYRLPGGSRVADAVTAAGGPTTEARLGLLNLARPLLDGEQVVVPGPEDAAAAGSARAADGILDLNRASAAELTELPGIGPVLAERIVAHRAAHGPLRSVDGLRAVRGIGAKLLAGLAGLVRV